MRTGEPSAGVTVDRGTRSDDADLRALLRRSPIPGSIQVAYVREPSFFGALRVEGSQNEVVVARRKDNGRAVGVGVRSLKPAWINGRESTLGYFSGLRIEPEFRNGTILSRGYRLFRECQRENPAEVHVTTIMEDNVLARRVLTSGRGGIPTYYDYGRFCTRAILCNPLTGFRNGASPEVQLRPATSGDVPDVVSFLAREGKRRQFFPCYGARDFNSDDGLLRGLVPDDILLAFRGKEIVGTVAAWDQRKFRQSILVGCHPAVSMARVLYNGFATLARRPRLLRPGGNLDYFVLALVCIREDDSRILSALLTKLALQNRRRFAFFVAGLHERDPLLPVLLRPRGFSYSSRLFIPCWEEGEAAFRGLDDRVPYLEVGAL